MLQEYRISDEGKIIEYDKVQVAIDRLREFEPPEGYFLAFSGGKDSVVIYDLAVRSGVKFDAHYNLTTVDPPELVQFIKRQYSEVEIHKPEKTMWQLIAKNKFPPLRHMRYCCRELKERGGKGRICVVGVRWAESPNRSKRSHYEVMTPKHKDKKLFNDNDEGRRMFENCTVKGKRVVNPIIEWSDEDVWNYINHNGIKYCSLYDEGFKRLGCVLCPMAGRVERAKHIERWPKLCRAWQRVIVRTYEEGLAEGRRGPWVNGEDMFKSWLVGETLGDPDQGVLFE